MKKSYILIAAAAMVMAACSNENTYEVADQEIGIDFNTFANKITRSTTGTNLESFHQSFGVWADKTIGSADAKSVMDNYEADYDDDYLNPSPAKAAQWNYEDVAGQYLKYWDMTATYKFDAYAPYSSNASISNHVISIANGQYAANENIQDSWSTTLNTNAFTGAGATATDASTDWMIAAQATRTPKTEGTDAVNLEFKHILSKVIVKIKKRNGFEEKITVKNVQLNNVYGTGSYNGTTWASGDAAVNIACLGGTLPKSTASGDPDPYYSLECLVIPATITPTFNVTYNIGDDTEDYIVENAEIETITEFVKGYNYTITVTVGPTPIQFDATVSAWTEASAAEVDVQ